MRNNVALLSLLLIALFSSALFAVDKVKETEFPVDDITGLYSVEIKGFSADFPLPGDRFGPLEFDLILELEYLPEEMLPFAVRPTAEEFRIFQAAVIELEPKIREFVDGFFKAKKAGTLMDGGEQSILRDRIIIFINDQLENHDFSRKEVRLTLSRRRITDVLFAKWMIM